jgi:hypothetical protein
MGKHYSITALCLLSSAPGMAIFLFTAGGKILALDTDNLPPLIARLRSA